MQQIFGYHRNQIDDCLIVVEYLFEDFVSAESYINVFFVGI